MTEARRLPLPAHLGVLLGTSAGVYAVLLASVAGLQSASEGRIAAERAPTISAIGSLSTGHDELLRRLEAGRLAYQGAAGAYAEAGTAFSDLEARLVDLSTSVQQVTGAAASLRTTVRLPAIRPTVSSAAATTGASATGASAPTSASAPTVVATTGASGVP